MVYTIDTKEPITMSVIVIIGVFIISVCSILIIKPQMVMVVDKSSGRVVFSRKLLVMISTIFSFVAGVITLLMMSNNPEIAGNHAYTTGLSFPSPEIAYAYSNRKF